MATTVPRRSAQLPVCCAEVATVAKNGALVLLDIKSRQVVRVEREARYWDGYRNARERIAAYVPSVPFELHLNGRVMSEPLISGTSFATLSPQQQLEGVRRILESYSELVANDRAGPSAAYLENVLSKAQRITLQGSLSERLPRAWLNGRAQSCPLVMSHGDTLPRNFIFGEAGPILIDFDPALLQPRPFWFDPIKIFLAWESEEIVKFLLRGQLDSELDELWKAAGEQSTDRVEPLELLAAASLLNGYTVSGSGRNVEKFERRTRKAFAVVRSAQRGLEGASVVDQRTS